MATASTATRSASSPIAAPSGAAADLPIPALIRRNTLLLAASQAIVGIGSQMIPTLAPVMIVRLSGSDALLGVAVAASGVSKFLAAYPVGQVTDRYGRKAGLLLGSALSMLGSLVLGTAVVWWSLPLLVAGLLVFGAGVAANQQLRLAAADMYPPSRRAEGLGYVLTGSLAGALLAPMLMSGAQSAAPGLGLDPAALAWLLVPLTLLPCMALLALVRPDPKEIATNLWRYYPGLAAPSVPALPVSSATDGAALAATTVVVANPLAARPAALPQPSLVVWLREYPKLVAFTCSGLAQGTMTLMMALTSVSLAHHGHEFSAISVSVAIHVVGMFGFSLPLGRLCDRAGRRPVLLAGLGVLAAGAILVPTTSDYWVATLGTFLVGLGWSAASVAASALIADTTVPEQRGRAIGLNDSFAAAGAIVFPLLGGPVAAAFGLVAVGLLTAAAIAPAMLLAARLPAHLTRSA
jgi:MFS family permease